MPPDGTAPASSPDFESHRRRLMGLAYRMLGSVAEAEDVVQDAWMRWHATDRDTVRDPAAFLHRVCVRLCLDRLKSARAQRETYVGPWLPEPVLDPAELDAGERAADISFALMLALERLSPLERAAFLLHDVFDLDFAEIATAIDRSEAACRQLAARARAHVRAARPRFPVSAEQGEAVLGAFLRAVRSGDTDGLGRLLADDAVLRSDGGGQRPAALNPIVGRERIVRFFAGLARKGRLGASGRMVQVNGMPGVMAWRSDGRPDVLALEIADGRIAALYAISNPDKLRHVPGYAAART